MKQKGFSLTELIIGIVLLSIVSAGLFAVLKFPADANIYTQKEFDVQSDLRKASDTINVYTKNATAAFLLTKHDNRFKSFWNYFICEVSDGFSRIVLYKWNGSTHEKIVLAELPDDEVTYDIGFQRNEDGKLLRYFINAEDIKRNRNYDIESEVKVLNSSNIIDEAKMNYRLSPPQKRANCLAFRSDIPDPDTHDQGYHHVLISFVLDTSGSMEWNLDGYNTGPANKRRINILKEELKKFFQKLKDQDKTGVIDVRMYPFSTRVFDANSNFEPANIYGKYLSIKDNTLAYFNGMVNSMNVGGGTNVGDGIRFAYHGFKKYEDEKRSVPGGENLRIKHFLFVLSDGRPTFFSYTQKPWELNPDEYDPYEFFSQTTGKMRFVYSDRAIDWNKVKYGGRGNNVSPDEAEIIYIERLGLKVKAYESQNPKEGIDATVVGFSNNSIDNKYCNRIGRALGTKQGDDGKYYKDCNSPEALQAVFDAFTESIVAATLWYVSGPQ